jgi:ABC-type Na+ efflux pump permease subunit
MFRSALPDSDELIMFGKILPPVILAMVIVALWAWVAIEIQIMQPYISLVHGPAPANKSILLDYTRERCVDFHYPSLCANLNILLFSSKFGACRLAFSNRHYAVAIVTMAAILALILKPLCASVFVLKDTWWGPDRLYPCSQLTDK